MKPVNLFVALSLTIVYCETCFSGISRINIQNNFGFTMINLEKVIGSPFYDESLLATETQIVEWNQFFYKGVAQAMFEENNGISYGIEGGVNHLYYWRERYVSDWGTGPYPDREYDFRWNDVWTLQAGALVDYHMAKDIHLQAGASLHLFFTSYGAAIGIMGAAQYDWKTEFFRFLGTGTVPLQVRYDIIFGEGMPSALNAGIGLTYALK